MTSEKKVLALSIIAFVFNFALVVVLILDQKVPRVRLCCHTNDSCTEEIKKNCRLSSNQSRENLRVKCTETDKNIRSLM